MACRHLAELREMMSEMNFKKQLAIESYKEAHAWGRKLLENQYKLTAIIFTFNTLLFGILAFTVSLRVLENFTTMGLIVVVMAGLFGLVFNAGAVGSVLKTGLFSLKLQKSL